MRWRMLILLFLARIALGFQFQAMASVGDRLAGAVPGLACGPVGSVWGGPGAGRSRSCRAGGRWPCLRCGTGAGDGRTRAAGFGSRGALLHALLHQDDRRLVRRARDGDGDERSCDELAVRHCHGAGGPRLDRAALRLARALRRGLGLLRPGVSRRPRLLSSAERADPHRCAADRPPSAARMGSDPVRGHCLGCLQRRLRDLA